MRPEALKVENLKVKYYRPNKILFSKKPISFTLNQGDVFCVLGSSGCGKSTLMDACLNNVPSFEGKIFFDPQSHTVQFNENKLINERTFEYNLKTYLRLNDNLPDEDYFKRIKEYIDTNQNFSYYDPVGPCSFGTRRRIDLYLRLFEPNKKLFFLDEPTQGLDSYSVNRIVELIKQFHNSKITFFIVTHEQQFMEIANKVLLLSENDYCLISELDEIGLFKVKKVDWKKILKEVIKRNGNFSIAFENSKQSTMIIKSLDPYTHDQINDLLKKNNVTYFFQHWKKKEEGLKNLLKVYFK